MKIALRSILENRTYWMQKVLLLGYDLSIRLNGQEYELLGIHGSVEAPTSYVLYKGAGGEYTRVGFEEVDYVYVGEEDVVDLKEQVEYLRGKGVSPPEEILWE